MKIAVTYQNGEVFQHFGQTKEFKVYNVSDNKIVDSNVIGTNGAGHGALAGFLKSEGADSVICGGIGDGAIAALSKEGIKIYAGVNGNTDNVVNDLITGKLVYSSDANCSHHEHEHGGDGGHTHECGEHGCR